MNKKNLLILSGIILGLVTVGAGCFSSDNTSPDVNTIVPNDNSSSNGGTTSSTDQTNTTTLNNQQKVFADQSYYPNAYLISGSTLTAEAKKALSGFQLTKKQQADGTTVYTLKALKSGYQNQEYTLQPGQLLYFVDNILSDDNESANTDQNYADDFGVVVDSNGYVISEPAGFNSTSSSSSRTSASATMEGAPNDIR